MKSNCEHLIICLTKASNNTSLTGKQFQTRIVAGRPLALLAHALNFTFLWCIFYQILFHVFQVTCLIKVFLFGKKKRFPCTCFFYPALISIFKQWATLHLLRPAHNEFSDNVPPYTCVCPTTNDLYMYLAVQSRGRVMHLCINKPGHHWFK